MPTYHRPGIYREDVFPPLAAELLTGVPAFLGFTQQEPPVFPQPLTLWPQFEEYFGAPLLGGYLGHAVRGFFENDGRLCYVVSLPRTDDPLQAIEALDAALAKVELLDAVDLICAPDLMLAPSQALVLQQRVLEHCDSTGERFAILDALPGAIAVREQQFSLGSANGALYYPWVLVADGSSTSFVPPCGHIAGVYARSDRGNGVHKAPANEVLEGVLDLQTELTDLQQAELNQPTADGAPAYVNCLRSFPGRGIRIWGARTLSDDPVWVYVGVRRLFLAIGRWVERNLADAVWEPNTPVLWTRISRELTGYLNQLLERGALKGRTAQEAFYVKCDAELNPPAVRELGQLVTEIGLAPTIPNEFVVVRIIHRSTGTDIAGPVRRV